MLKRRREVSLGGNVSDVEKDIDSFTLVMLKRTLVV